MQEDLYHGEEERGGRDALGIPNLFTHVWDMRHLQNSGSWLL